MSRARLKKGRNMITVNGKQIPWESPVSVADYLEANGYKRNRIAVEINYEIVPKSQYETTFLQDNDVMEVVSFVGGG